MKLDALPPRILDDIRAGLEFEHSEKKCKFVCGLAGLYVFPSLFAIVISIPVAYLGSKRATRHFKLERMAEWEQDEYARELEYMNKTTKGNGSKEWIWINKKRY